MKEKPKRLFNLHFLELMLLSFATSLGFSMISTLITAYSVSIGSTLAYAGFVAGAFSIAALLLRPLGGFFSDNYNRKYILVITTAITSACLFGYSACHALIPLVLFRLLHGATFGINTTVNLAMATEYIPDDRMNEGIGIFGIGQVVSQIIGPSIGLWIKDTYGFSALFVSAGGLVLGAALLILFGLRYERERAAKQECAEHSEKGGFRLSSFVARECILYALIGGIFSVGNGVTNNFLVLIGKERGISGISLFFIINATGLFLLRLTVGKILDRVSLFIIVNVSLAVSGIAMLLIGCAAGVVPILIAAVLKAMGNVGGQISLQTACVKKVDAARIGIATSTFYIGGDLGNGLGPILAGKIADISDYQTTFVCMAALFAIGMAAFSVYEHGRRGERNEGAQEKFI